MEERVCQASPLEKDQDTNGGSNDVIGEGIEREMAKPIEEGTTEDRFGEEGGVSSIEYSTRWRGRRGFDDGRDNAVCDLFRILLVRRLARGRERYGWSGHFKKWCESTFLSLSASRWDSIFSIHRISFLFFDSTFPLLLSPMRHISQRGRGSLVPQLSSFPAFS